MAINANTQSLSDKIIPIILQYFDVPYDKLQDKRGTNNEHTARMYVCYILHKHSNISSMQLSYVMGRCDRNIKRSIAKIKFDISHYDECRDDYEQLIEKIKEQIPSFR